MNPPPVRIAIIGMGGYAGAHHRALITLETKGESRLVCTCDPQAGFFAAQQTEWEFAKRGVRVFSDYREMLSACTGELDMVVIPTPISLHAEMHRACVERGLAVYLEKPPTLDPEELERMIATDDDAPRPTLVGFNFIIEPFRLALKQRILAGEFGALREARLLALWPRSDHYFQRNGWAGRLLTPDGRLILDSCCGNAMAHFVHNTLFWAGGPALAQWASLQHVKAELYRAHPIEGADTFIMQAVTENGATLRLALTHACHGNSCQTETVVCENATLTYEVGSHTEIAWPDGHRERLPLPPFDPVIENHRAYYRCLRRQVERPATRLIDSRPFVHLNALAYLSSGEITTFPAERISSRNDNQKRNLYQHVDGLAEALDAFVAHGTWPGEALGWRTQPARLATTAELPRLHGLIDKLAGRT